MWIDQCFFPAKSLMLMCLAMLTLLPGTDLIGVSMKLPLDLSDRNNESRPLRTDQQFYDSGITFLDTCSAVNRLQTGHPGPRDTAHAQACESYVSGIADGVTLQHIWSRSHGDTGKAAFCIQFKNAPPPRLVDAVLQYLREHPEKRTFRAAIAVEEVLHSRFPCH